MKSRTWFRRHADTGDHRRILGRRGERVAARHLRRQGYRIVERNLSVGKDEVDLLALAPDGRTVVIVEVKTRRDASIAPEASVNPQKQYRLARLAAKLQQRRDYADRPFRFDAVIVVWPEGGKPEVRHYAGAFESPF